MTIQQAVVALQLLSRQLTALDAAQSQECEEITINQGEIRLKRGGKTLRVPLVQLG